MPSYKYKRILLLALASALPPSSANSLPRISIQQLRSAAAAGQDPTAIDLRRLLLDSRGIVRISLGDDPNDGFSSLRKRALGDLCDCPAFLSDGAFDDVLGAHPVDLQRVTLPDGSVRRTLGTGSDVVAEDSARRADLPPWVGKECGADARAAFEGLRDAVAEAVDVFVEALDREGGVEGGLSGDWSFRRALSNVDHPEHFHVYAKDDDDRERGTKSASDTGKAMATETSNQGMEKRLLTLDYHTDAGLFLAFVPAMDCRSSSRAVENSSFYLKGREGPIAFEDDEVVVMMGAGAQHWLPPALSEGRRLPAASHALRLAPGARRAWYGKMHLLPSSLEESGGEDSIRRGEGRRLQDHVSSPADCNNRTDFFCWYQCIDIPESGRAEEHLEGGRSLYCLDPARLSDGSVSDAAEPCKGGYAHEPSCVGRWHETDEDVPGYELPHLADSNANANATTSGAPTASPVAPPAPEKSGAFTTKNSMAFLIVTGLAGVMQML